MLLVVWTFARVRERSTHCPQLERPLVSCVLRWIVDAHTCVADCGKDSSFLVSFPCYHRPLPLRFMPSSSRQHVYYSLSCSNHPAHTGKSPSLLAVMPPLRSDALLICLLHLPDASAFSITSHTHLHTLTRIIFPPYPRQSKLVSRKWILGSRNSRTNSHQRFEFRC